MSPASCHPSSCQPADFEDFSLILYKYKKRGTLRSPSVSISYKIQALLGGWTGNKAIIILINFELDV